MRSSKRVAAPCAAQDGLAHARHECCQQQLPRHCRRLSGAAAAVAGWPYCNGRWTVDLGCRATLVRHSTGILVQKQLRWRVPSQLADVRVNALSTQHGAGVLASCGDSAGLPCGGARVDKDAGYPVAQKRLNERRATCASTAAVRDCCITDYHAK